MQQMKAKKKLSRDQFGDLMINSLCDIEKFNATVSKDLGFTIKVFTGYEYYYGDQFICSTEDLCVDDLIEAAGFEVKD